MCQSQKACAVEASLIDASILEWNSTCTATCGVSTTETGGSSSESCASNDEKKKKKKRQSRAKAVFFCWVAVPNVKLQKLSSATNFGGAFTHLEKLRPKKNMGITNDVDMAHVAGHANSMRSLTTPVPCFFREEHELKQIKKTLSKHRFRPVKILPMPVFLADLIWELKVFFLLTA